ncbi:MAG: tetratricopeptide repeat protein [Acidobacteriota bacterium]
MRAPKSAAVFYYLGEVFLASGDTSKATQFFTRALQFTGGAALSAELKSVAYVRLGEMYSRKEMLQEASEAFSAAIRVNPLNHRAWRELGWSHFRLTRSVSSAEALILRAAKISTLPQYYIDLSDIHRLAGNFDRAFHYAKLARTSGAFGGSATARARIHFDRREFDLAVRELRLAVSSGGQDFDTFFWLGRAYLALNDRPKCEEAFLEALRFKTSPEVFLSMAELYTSEGRLSEARRILARGLQAHPQNEDLLEMSNSIGQR